MPPRRKPAAGRDKGEAIPAECAPQAHGADRGGLAGEGDGPLTTGNEERERWIDAGPSSVGEKLVDTTLLHARFGDVMNELVFSGLCRITQLVIGAVPAGGARVSDGGDGATINVFGKVVDGGASTARFECLYERFQQPESGDATVPLNGVITRHLVFRGHYQTVPVCVYGWKLDDLATCDDGDRAAGVDVEARMLGEDERLFCACPLVGKDLLIGLGKDEIGGDVARHGETVLLDVSEMADVVCGDGARASPDLGSLMGRLESVVGRVYENNLLGSDVASPVMAAAEWAEVDGDSDAVMLAGKRRRVANHGILWISSLFAVIHAGSVPSPALVSLGSAGLDLLAVALQDARVAKGFASHGGCAILRYILGVRGLPGSFYNKSVALACEVLRQAGEVGVKALQEVKASGEWRLGHENGFFEMVEDVDREILAAKKTEEDGGRGRKRKTSPSAGGDGDGGDDQSHGKEAVVGTEGAADVRDEPSELQRELADIAGGVYAGRIKDLWEAQLRSRLTLAEAISGHGGRFKPKAGTTHINAVSAVLNFHQSVKDVVRELRDLKDGLEGVQEGDAEGAASGTRRNAPDPLRNISSAEEALQGLASIVARTPMCNLSVDGKGCRDCADPWDAAVLVQVFAKLLCDCEVLESVAGVIECVDKLGNASNSGGSKNPSPKLVGALSSVTVDFLSAMLDQPGCLAFSSVGVLQRTVLSSVLASDANPHFVAYRGYAARVGSMLEANRALVRLAAADWDSFNTTGLVISNIHLTYDNFMFRGVGDQLLERCEEALTRYIRANSAAGGQEAGGDHQKPGNVKGMELSLSFTLDVLQRLLVAADPRLLQWWIPRAGRFHDLMVSLVGQKALLASDESVTIAQRVMGGLSVCSKIHANGGDGAGGAVGTGASGSMAALVGVISSHLPWATIKDNTDGVMDASEYFDVLDATFFGNAVSVSMSWDDVRLLVDDAEILGQLVTSMSILRSYLEHSNEGPGTLQRLGGNHLLLRALVCATEVLSASRADNMWAHRVGTSMDFCSMSNNKTIATELFETVSRCMYYYLKGVARIATVESLPLLQTLIKAHAATAIDTQTMMDAGMKTSFVDQSTLSMRNARWNVTRALRFWISCPGLRPRVIPTALVGAVAAPAKNGCTVSFSPTATLCLSLLLGDIFPSEWPKTASVNVLTPDDKRYRASLTEELESCIVPLEYMILCCASSDLSYIRAATVRFLCKGAGLGGGMGTFLMGIISTQFDEALLPMTFAQVGMYDARKVLELLVPLLYQPALKSAALDTTIPQTIAKMVETIVHQSVTFGTAFDRIESASLITMALECLTALADPSITLDVFRLDRPGDAADVLRREAGAAICCTIFEHITLLGENVPLALNLLETMADNRRGRENILHGIVKLCTKAQAEQIEHPTAEQVLTAAQWLVHQYQTIQAQAEEQVPDEVSKETTKYVFGTLESILKRACVGGLHYDVDLPPMDSRGAPVKFAAQAKEATSRGVRRFVPDFPCNGGHIQLLQDCQELVVFWKNQRLRPISPASAVTNAAKLSKYVNWDIGSETMDKFCIAGILHPWLTHPRRPLNESMRAQPDHDPEQLDQGQGTTLLDTSLETAPQRDLPASDHADMAIDAMDAEEETGKAPAIDTQVNVDLGALPDLFRQQPQQTQAAQAAQAAEAAEAVQTAKDEEEIDDDFDLYADLMPATVTKPDDD